MADDQQPAGGQGEFRDYPSKKTEYTDAPKKGAGWEFPGRLSDMACCAVSLGALLAVLASAAMAPVAWHR